MRASTDELFDTSSPLVSAVGLTLDAAPNLQLTGQASRML